MQKITNLGPQKIHILPQLVMRRAISGGFTPLSFTIYYMVSCNKNCIPFFFVILALLL